MSALILTSLANRTQAGTAYGPLTYFDRACARCHGPEGYNYSKGFAGKYTKAGLVEEIQRMADGPGNEPLSPKQLESQLVMHQAMSGRLGFVFIREIKGNTIIGEATGIKVVEVRVGTNLVKTKVKDLEWSVTVPKAQQAKSFVQLGSSRLPLVVGRFAIAPTSAKVPK